MRQFFLNKICKFVNLVDVWAIGCILAEMILQKILFPGTDRIDQWSKITNILGSPPKEFINRFNSFMLTFCVLNSEAQRILIVFMARAKWSLAAFLPFCQLQT